MDTPPANAGSTPPASETWTFTAMPGVADRVYLVLDDGGPSRWVPMQPVPGQRGSWNTTVRLTPGRYQARHFIETAGTYINCGDTGLTAVRAPGPPAGVQLEPFSIQAA